jgi:hypothetical protein
MIPTTRPLRRLGLAVLLTLAVASCITPRTAAAGPLDCDCNPDSVMALTNAAIEDGWLEMHPRTTERDVAELRALGRWSAALDVIRSRFRARAPLLPDAARALLVGALDSARTIVADLESRPGGKLGTDRAPQAWFTVTLDAESETFHALGGLPGGPVVLADTMPSAQRRVACWTAMSMERLLNHMNASGRASALVMVRDRYQRWENYARFGYSQFPLELVVNGLREEKARRRSRSLEPPSSQWVVLHPSAGAELAVADGAGNFRQPRAWIETQAIVLELAGILFYRSQQKDYSGISAIATFPASQAVGVGALVHLTRTLKAGVVYHGDEPKRLGLLASLDLRRWLSDTPTGVRQVLDRAKSEVLKSYSE